MYYTLEQMRTLEVDTQILEVGADGYLHYKGQRKATDVLADITAALGTDIVGASEGFGLSVLWRYVDGKGMDADFPKGRIQVVAIRGGCEGYYVDVQVMDRDTRVITSVFQGKDLSGDRGEATWALAHMLSEMLGDN